MLTEPYVQAHVYRADGFLVGNPAHIMQRTSIVLQHRHGLGWIESIPSKNWGHGSCLSCLYPVAKTTISGSQPWPVQELSHLARKLMCSNCHSGRKGGRICLFSCQKTLPKCFLLFRTERMSGVWLATLFTSCLQEVWGYDILDKWGRRPWTHFWGVRDSPWASTQHTYTSGPPSLGLGIQPHGASPANVSAFLHPN